jgi:hypothetical protein
MPNHPVGVRIEKVEGLIAVSTDVLRTAFETGLHPAAVPLNIKSAGDTWSLRY